MKMGAYYDYVCPPKPKRKKWVKAFLKEALSVVATFVISSVVVFGGIYYVASLIPPAKGKIPELQARGCQFVKKEWTGKDSSYDGRWYSQVTFEFKKTWKCNDGFHYELVKETMSQGQVLRMIRDGLY